MARNVERDAREAELRRERLMNEGFRLFSENGIEEVSLQSVANAAGVGIATMYNYYSTKVNLIVAISAKIWSDVWKKYINKIDAETFQKISAYEAIELYCNAMIDIYNNHPEVLRFSSDYKTYMCRKGFQSEQANEHIDALEPFAAMFHQRFLKSREDKSIRQDIDEKELFTTVAMTMLGMAERYAQGLVWIRDESKDYSKELSNLKEMILSWVKG